MGGDEPTPINDRAAVPCDGGEGPSPGDSGEGPSPGDGGGAVPCDGGEARIIGWGSWRSEGRVGVS